MMAMPREAIQRRAVGAYLAGVNAERYDDAAALFAPVGVLSGEGTTPIHARDGIAAYLHTTLSGYAAHWETPTRELHGDGIAVVDVRFSAEDQSGARLERDAVYVFDFDPDGALSRLRRCGGHDAYRRRDEPHARDQPPRQMPDYDQVGILVTDLEAAMTALGKAVGVDWTGPLERQIGPWRLRIALSRDGRLELVEGEAGSPWDSSAGSRIDHLAYFVEDLPTHQRRLTDAGFPLAIDGNEFGGQWSYHETAEAGMRIELVDASQREGYFERARGNA
jgi:hypothetical protein